MNATQIGLKVERQDELRGRTGARPRETRDPVRAREVGLISGGAPALRHAYRSADTVDRSIAVGGTVASLTW